MMYQQGALVSQNMSSGVIISTHSLVLQRVTRWHSGAYTCLAANPRGENVSNPVMLRVRCKYEWFINTEKRTNNTCYAIHFAGFFACFSAKGMKIKLNHKLFNYLLYTCQRMQLHIFLPHVLIILSIKFLKYNIFRDADN